VGATPAAAGTPGRQFVERVVHAADQSGNGTLQHFVARCTEYDLFARFIAADEEATRLQTVHKAAVHLAVWPSTAALLIGIVQLPFEPLRSHQAVLILELLLILYTTLVVVVAKYADWHREWLLARYQAELYRLLIFDTLIEPGLWSGDDLARRDWGLRFRKELSEIAAITTKTLDGEAEKPCLPRIPSPSELATATGTAIVMTAISPLTAYYRDAWLTSQIEYFQAKVTAGKKRHWDRPIVVSVVFAVTVFCVLLHVFAGLLHQEQIGLRILLAAALLPAGFTAFHTLRSALELSRNAARAAARLHEANTLIDNLRGDFDEDSDRPHPGDEVWFQFRTLALAQGLLQAEQREWLRLMIETEWTP
jgi:hypothetical protein